MKSKRKILLVDDEPAILQTLKLILSSDGHAVETAWNGSAAMQVVTKRRFDLVITDFSMPGMQGDDLSVLIKERWPGTPILMLSGSADVLRSTKRQMPGVDVLMSKPWNLAELRREVTQLLAGTATSTDPISAPKSSNPPNRSRVLAGPVREESDQVNRPEPPGAKTIELLMHF